MGSLINTKKSGGENVRKKLVVLLILASLLMIPTVSAAPRKKVLRCSCSIKFNAVEWQWEGTIELPTGTCDIIFHADPEPRFVGHPSDIFGRHLEKFHETWEIFDGDDGYASGYDWGIFSEDSWDYKINGKVEYATGTLAYLKGGKLHGTGTAWLDDTFYGEGIIQFSGYAG